MYPLSIKTIPKLNKNQNQSDFNWNQTKLNQKPESIWFQLNRTKIKPRTLTKKDPN